MAHEEEQNHDTGMIGRAFGTTLEQIAWYTFTD